MSKNNYLQDRDFLKKFDSTSLKEQYVKIIILDWAERPIQELTGHAIGGSLNLDGNSAMRRSASLEIFLDKTENTVTNPNFFLSINKKIKLEIGFKNTLSAIAYENVPILWFPLGLYVITQISLSHSTNGVTASLQLHDKMCLLNGECGGTLPASVNFSEIEYIDEKGNLCIKKPTIYQIIYEAVNHWGKEPLHKILIGDLDTQIKKVMKWTGRMDVYMICDYNYESIDSQIIILNQSELTTDKEKTSGLEEVFTVDDLFTVPQQPLKKYKTFKYNEDIGYIYSDFYYPGEDLIGEGGTSVCDILEILKNTLGNFEYFYDVNGIFHFQEIKNYLNTSLSTLVLNQIGNDDYLMAQGLDKTVYDFNDSNLITSYTNNPRLDMIKNDFIVWGERENATGLKVPIRYHLAIDSKPSYKNEQIEVLKYLDPNDNLYKAKRIIECEAEDLPRPGEENIFYLTNNQILTWRNKKSDYEEIKDMPIETVNIQDWRTKLYLDGVDVEPFGIEANDYYVELKNEWVKLYDIWSKENKDHFKVEGPDADYFLDFIDTGASISELSISNIGKRTKVVNDNKINCLFAPPIPNIIFIQSNRYDTAEELQKIIEKCREENLNWTLVDDTIYSLLGGGGSKNSAFNKIKELLYQYTSYNEQISLSCLPIYYLEPNTLISVTDSTTNIGGNYLINSLSIPLSADGIMSISATRALERF